MRLTQEDRGIEKGGGGCARLVTRKKKKFLLSKTATIIGKRDVHTKKEGKKGISETEKTEM